VKYILHIDTSGELGFVALGKDGHLLSFKEQPDARNQAASINHDITTVLADAGITLSELSAVAVCSGPGSYTGLRIGLSTAKALCYVLDIPLITHDKLSLLALGQCHSFLSEYDYYVAVLMAREGEYFISSYNNKFEQVIEPQHILEDELKLKISELKGKKLISSNISTSLKQITETDITEDQCIKIETWIKDFVNLSTAEPLYLKQVYTHKPNKIN
jgi:tRNA threonylcarbamoyladenosine biosynthesis protein TsaB